MTNNSDIFLRELQKPVAASAAMPMAKTAKKLGYIREPGVMSLSYSMWQTLLSCPRKFLLRELHNNMRTEFKSTHLAFGSALGAGLAEICRTNSIERAFAVAFSQWDYLDFGDGGNRGKSFAECLQSLIHFHELIWPELSEEWQMAEFEGKPAVELLFYVRVTEQYAYQGHIDIVLQNKLTGALGVFEVKTSARTHTAATWENSEQALGYYKVLNWMQERMGIVAHPQTIYLCLQTSQWHEREKNFGFKVLPFTRDETALLEFANTLYSDLHTLDMYIANNYFPKRGKSCEAYGRVCEFFGVCDNAQMQTPEEVEVSQYEVLSPDAADIYIDMRQE